MKSKLYLYGNDAAWRAYGTQSQIFDDRIIAEGDFMRIIPESINNKHVIVIKQFSGETTFEITGGSKLPEQFSMYRVNSNMECSSAVFKDRIATNPLIVERESKAIFTFANSNTFGTWKLCARFAHYTDIDVGTLKVEKKDLSKFIDAIWAFIRRIFSWFSSFFSRMFKR